MAFVKCAQALVLVLSTLLPATAQVAERPPMGWNSWDAYGLTINEEQFRANAMVEAKTLRPYGWIYAIIDEGWYMENPEDRQTPGKLRYALDGFGRYVPSPERFPGAASGGESSFTALASWVHGQGLKFGIHIVRGIPRESARRDLPVEGSKFHASDVADTTDVCPWDPTNWGVRDNAAGQAWYDSLFRQYALWGVDLVKVDCIGDHPYKVSEIRMIRKAIDRAGRPIVLSLSPGPMNLEHAAEVRSLAEMWRISDDIWDFWDNTKSWPKSVRSQFRTTAAWTPFSGGGHWPDADMLPFGELRPAPGFGDGRTTRLTHAEQQTMFALWCIARSPLILGANLTLLDNWTTGVLTNASLLSIDQAAVASREVRHDDDIVVWTADLRDGSKALAIFNLRDSSRKVDESLQAYGFHGQNWRVTDVWTGKQLGKQKRVAGSISAHGCLVWILKQI
jgi:alpha-galactosidase